MENSKIKPNRKPKQTGERTFFPFELVLVFNYQTDKV